MSGGDRNPSGLEIEGVDTAEGGPWRLSATQVVVAYAHFVVGHCLSLACVWLLVVGIQIYNEQNQLEKAKKAVFRISLVAIIRLD